MIAISGLVEIAPIKINPWSKILRWIGNKLNGDVLVKVDALENKVQLIGDWQEKYEVKAARVRILHFDDEMYLGQKHSKEHFINTLADIKTYNDYCREPPSFENERTKLTEEHIRNAYQHCLEEHTFLQ